MNVLLPNQSVDIDSATGSLPLIIVIGEDQKRPGFDTKAINLLVMAFYY